MSKLVIDLPPFAPDYSGACSALFELEGIAVIHDASGCTGNYTGYDEPRWYGSRSGVFCSGLRDIDATMGDDAKFVQRISQAVRDLKPRFACLMGSPVPMVIGSDLKGIAAEIEHETSVPAFGFDTTGLQYYDKGISDAFCAFASRFLAESALPKIERGLNILGATPLDLSMNANLSDLNCALLEGGFEIVSNFSMGASFEKALRASQATINLVVAHSGLKLGEFLHRRFGIPYVVGLPVGESGTEKLFSLLESTLRDGKRRVLKTPDGERQNGTGKILIVAEETLGHSLKYYLAEEKGLSPSDIDVGCLFGTDGILYENTSRQLKNEREIRSALNEGYEAVIADPLLNGLLKRGTRSFDFPHIAVSSKLYSDRCVRFIGQHVTDWSACVRGL